MPPADPYRRDIGPWSQGPFVRKSASGNREACVGQWALIADNAKEESLQQDSGALLRQWRRLLLLADVEVHQ